MIKNEAQFIQLERSVSRLREVLEKIKKVKEDKDVFRDSAIQRFEISFDLAWKTLKEKLRSEYGVDSTSPKKVFQDAFSQGIIENDPLWLSMTDMRNETTHAYNELFAESVLEKLPDICTAFEHLLWKLKK